MTGGLRNERGQAMVLSVLFVVAMIGFAALVVDVGAWFRGQRHLQTVADAAALAGAQDLPNTSTAQATAATYAQENWAGVTPPTVTFPDPNTIDVQATQPVNGVFSRVYGAAFSTIDVHAHARARAGVPSSVKNIAPLVVNQSQPMLTGAGCSQTTPCFGPTHSTTLNFNETSLTSSMFGVININCPGALATCHDAADSNDIVGWINDGFQGYVSVNSWYPAATGEKIGPVRDALIDNENRPLLFPVFDTADNVAKNFHVVSWSAFVITNVTKWQPADKRIVGYFTEVIVSGFLSGTGSGPPNYGVKVVGLVG
jgi:Flp pilus assembly protein TadG